MSRHSHIFFTNSLLHQKIRDRADFDCLSVLQKVRLYRIFHCHLMQSPPTRHLQCTANLRRFFAVYCKSSLFFCSVLQIDCGILLSSNEKTRPAGGRGRPVTLPLIKTMSSMIAGHRIRWFSGRRRSSSAADTSS